MRNTHHRLLCAVPIVGAGTQNDPRRPAYAPLPGKPSLAGIIGFSYLPSDDGKFALVEFVAADRAAFAPILADKSLKVFEKGKTGRAGIEAEFRKFRKNLDLDQLGVMVP